ncbi:hypothetical protein KKG24_05435 [Patescibacteria group bacterium]|nr:hypothetical protein [Patescibacteria group bacterium]
MEETTNKSGMSTGMIIGIAVMVAIVFGGGAYAYVNNKAEKEKKDLNVQITELQKISAVSDASSNADTSDWKTYTNDVFKYTIKYPNNYQLADDCYNKDENQRSSWSSSAQEGVKDKYAVIIDQAIADNFPTCGEYNLPNDKLINIYINEPSADLNNKEYSTEEYQWAKQTGTKQEEKVITINNRKWYQVIQNQKSNNGIYYTEINSIKNNKIYYIQWKNADSKGTHDPLIDQIVNAFQFTE